MPTRQTTADACATLNGVQVASANLKTSWDGTNAGFDQQALLLTDHFNDDITAAWRPSGCCCCFLASLCFAERSMLIVLVWLGSLNIEMGNNTFLHFHSQCIRKEMFAPWTKSFEIIFFVLLDKLFSD